MNSYTILSFLINKENIKAMSTIHFRNKNYDPSKIVKLVADSHLEDVPNDKISEISSAKNFEALIAIKVENVYHVLTGSIDKSKPTNQLRVITKHVLARAEVRPTTYSERVAPRQNNFSTSFSRANNGQVNAQFRQSRGSNRGG